jgi:thiaminase/transcriptional activator TenA
MFGECALEAVAVEQALHGQYLTQFGADALQAEASPDCLAYTSFLLATAYHEPWEVLMAALLPCFWIYWDVGNAIARQAAPDNKYRAWIDTYSDEGFGNAVRMMTAFTRSSQFEYLFWDGAYQLRRWPAEG